MAKMPCTFYEKRIKPGTKALSGNGIIDNTDNICQNDQESAREQLRHVVDELKNRFPKAMKFLKKQKKKSWHIWLFPVSIGHRYTPPILLRDLTGNSPSNGCCLHISKSWGGNPIGRSNAHGTKWWMESRAALFQSGINVKDYIDKWIYIDTSSFIT